MKDVKKIQASEEGNAMASLISAGAAVTGSVFRLRNSVQMAMIYGEFLSVAQSKRGNLYLLFESKESVKIFAGDHHESMKRSSNHE